jgi:hypothetical protein
MTKNVSKTEAWPALRCLIKRSKFVQDMILEECSATWSCRVSKDKETLECIKKRVEMYMHPKKKQKELRMCGPS